MGYSRATTAGLVGFSGHLVEIEADLSNGLPSVVLSGLPDSALYEARDRVRAAITNSGLPWPDRRLTVNLLPADLPKHGSSFDLGMAVAILGSAGQVPPERVRDLVLVGELGLDGAIRPVRGVLPMMLASVRAGFTRAIVPVGNAAEASVVPGLTVRTCACLAEIVRYLRDGAPLPPPPPARTTAARQLPDLADVAGQELGRRAVEVAAAGGHHLALMGPPGAGKTMLAERLPSVLPELDDPSALEVTALHSIAGVLDSGALIRCPPFQAPHHTASVAALVGGGSGLARPGAISLAHRGVLFLDEAPEFASRALEAMRQPLERGEIQLRRTAGGATFPARIQLILAANPCPCARPAGDVACECPPQVRRRYLARLSGPLMDRVDIQVDLSPLSAAELMACDSAPESSTVVAARVGRARELAADRWRRLNHATNAEVPGAVLRSPRYRPTRADTHRLSQRLDSGSLSARGFDRALKVAWTLSDLDGRDRPDGADIDEALALRTGEPTR